MNHPRIYLQVMLFLAINDVIYAQLPSIPTDTIETHAEHRPGIGFPLFRNKYASLNFAAFATTRYLNQMGFEDEYTDAFGRTKNIDKRNDIQLQKVTLYFLGFLYDPRFRYVLYAWTSNANIGQTANVVVAGNMQFKFNKFIEAGIGIGGLPTSRSLYGSWPLWHRQDARPMAEEFFRGSFTTGIWLQGELWKGLYYKSMLGNNLSQLGIDAAQLDDGLDTWSTALWWTTRDYGRSAAFGDFENRKSIATVLGVSFSRSNETWQSQPDADAPENTQIRLSDGTALFSFNAFNNSSQVLEAKYEMLSVNGGAKYRGFALDAEYYLRWISKMKTSGDVPVSSLFDHGFSLQGSAMLIDKTLQVYSTGSYIAGDYGKPWEIDLGLNWYILKNRVLRVNPEVMFVDRSPVGYISYPTTVGATGWGFMINLELYY